MNRFFLLIPALITLLIVPTTVNGQCCDVPDGNPYADDIIPWNGIDIIDQTISVNGTLLVDGDMMIVNSTVIMSGKGLVLNTSSTLTVTGSVITSGSPEHGYYLDLSGSTYLEDVTLDGCIDEENGYFGIYMEGAELQALGLEMNRSGMIRLDGGSMEIEGSTITGVVSNLGDMKIKDTVVDRTGITQYGKGELHLDDVLISSNISFSQTAGISVIDDVDLHIEGLVMNGTFNAGIHSIESRLYLENSSMEFTDGLFGISASDSIIHRLENISIEGAGTGIELVNCSVESVLKGNTVKGSFVGINVQGNNPFSMIDSMISGPSYGLTSNAPMTVNNITFVDNDVGLLIEDGSDVTVSGCRFENFSQWAIEDETWTERYHSENTYVPTETSLGLVAWWGWLEIDIIGPGRIPVSGAEVVLESSLGSRFSVQATNVGAIWGYEGTDGDIGAVDYKIEAKWGTARKDMDFVPEKGRVVEVELPLADIKINDVKYENGKAIITVLSDRSDARVFGQQLEARLLLIPHPGIDPSRIETAGAQGQETA
ncbi:MAG: right-handed parallel beta-helix repeat-containing protein, partial [Thermoplasmatota archaeon]